MKALNFYRNCQLLLNFVQNIQTSAPSLTLQAVRRIRNMAQLLQNKIRDDDFPFDKACLQQIQNSSVNDNTGIQNFRSAVNGILRRAGRGCHQHLLQRAHVHIILLSSGNANPQNPEQDVQQHHDKRAKCAKAIECHADEVRQNQPDNTADNGKRKLLQIHFGKAFLCLIQPFQEQTCQWRSK